jgi:hypothetical protein
VAIVINAGAEGNGMKIVGCSALDSRPIGPWTPPRLYPQHLPVEQSLIGFTGRGESRRVSQNTQASGEKAFAHLGKFAESSFSEYCRRRHDSNVVAVPPLVDGMAAMRRFCPSPRP